MTELTLVKQDMFGEVGVNIYQNENNEVFMTVEQLAQVLEYKNKSGVEKIIQRNKYLKDSEFSTTDRLYAVDGKMRNVTLLTEDGIYEITMLSKQPKAQEFRFYIRQLLKGLRKGELKITANTPSYEIENPIERAKQWIKEFEYTMSLETENKELTPKAEYFDVTMNSKELFTANSIAKSLGFSAEKLNKLLHTLGIQYPQGGGWKLYAQHESFGYTKEITMVVNPNKTVTNMRWTPTGRKFVYDTLKELLIVVDSTSNKQRVEFILNNGLDKYKQALDTHLNAQKQLGDLFED